MGERFCLLVAHVDVVSCASACGAKRLVVTTHLTVVTRSHCVVAMLGGVRVVRQSVRARFENESEIRRADAVLVLYAFGDFAMCFAMGRDHCSVVSLIVALASIDAWHAPRVQSIGAASSRVFCVVAAHA
jgi:hypothetical protein